MTYWLSDGLRGLLRYEQVMVKVAAADCETPETEAVEEVPSLAWPVDVVAFDQARAAREHSIMSPPAPEASDEDYVLFLEAAHKEGKLYPCRTQDCMHTAPAPGDACPVCADKRQTPPYIGDAA